MPVVEMLFGAVFISLALLLTLGFFWLLFIIARKPLTVGADRIRIGAFLFPHDFSTSSLLLDEAEVFDIASNQRFARAVRLYYGFSFPKRQVGWFRLANEQDACVHIWDKSRALYIPMKDGRALVLGLDEPEGTLESL